MKRTAKLLAALCCLSLIAYGPVAIGAPHPEPALVNLTAADAPPAWTGTAIVEAQSPANRIPIPYMPRVQMEATPEPMPCPELAKDDSGTITGPDGRALTGGILLPDGAVLRLPERNAAVLPSEDEEYAVFMFLG